jgi:dTDP-4-amino-4,6-dideoxygalactose transaminase
MSVDTPIPPFDLSSEIDNIWQELNDEIQEVLRSGQFILGDTVSSFESEVADYLDVEHAVGVNSGTDAIIIGLRALGVEPGDEVIVPSFTFFATAEAVSMVGANPVFVDIEPGSFNMDPTEIEEAVTDNTEAIIPVHLFGCPAPMAQILDIAEKNDLFVVEDCAQSFGAHYQGSCIGCQGRRCPGDLRESITAQATGSIGHVGAYSFYPTKNLGAYGDGGLITTDKKEVAETAQMLRKHGGENKYRSKVLGYNSRLDAIQAAILSVKLPHVEDYNRARREVAHRYNKLLSDVPDVITPNIPDGHVFHQYTIRITNTKRDALQDALSDRGISTKVFYPVPCHQLPVYEDADHGQLPKAEKAATEVLSLPMWPQIEHKTQKKVANELKNCL